MSVREVIYYPNAPLLDKALPFEDITGDIAALARDMLDTMHAYEGVGLAGPQVGLSRRIFVMHEPEGEPRCLVNPEILDMSGSALGEEGCLSMPRVYAQVPRATWVAVRALDETGKLVEFEARDFAARIIQHEFDHLEGILFPDRLDILSREDKLREWDQVRAEMNAAIRAV